MSSLKLDLQAALMTQGTHANLATGSELLDKAEGMCEDSACCWLADALVAHLIFYLEHCGGCWRPHMLPQLPQTTSHPVGGSFWAAAVAAAGMHGGRRLCRMLTVLAASVL